MKTQEHLFDILVVGVLVLHVAHGQCPDYSIDGCKLWSDESTWPGNQIPEDNQAVIIDKCVVLDTDTARLGPVTIVTGGSIVFTPEVTADITLTASSVLVQGTLRIGSQKCRYEGRANVVLTGKPGENENPEFGSKFIGVAEGGTLELHGQKKLSWSKLNTTLEKLTPENGLHFTSDDAELDTWKNGFMVYVVDPSSGVVRYKKVLYTGNGNQRRFNQDTEELVTVMNSVPADMLIILVANKSPIHTANNYTHVYEAVEKAIYCNVGHSRLRHLQPGQGYVAIALKEHPKRTVEVIGRHEDQDGFRTAASHFSMPQNNMAIQAISKIHKSKSWKNVIRVIGAAYDSAVPRVQMASDVSTWVPGDRVVIASTDFDWAQAEEGVLEKCSVEHRDITCQPNEVRIRYLHKFMHWGEITHQVDMRAEVGHISRNIRILGEVERDAEGEELMFGGQIKIKENFKDVHIEGVELNQMGQHFTSDAFPIFFDMALNVSDVSYTHPAYVRDNSIVNSFRGCVALRATHGLHIANNVAYLHKGICFFLMEGGEKFNNIEGNLAIGTLEPEGDNSALMTYEQAKTASYFITNPLTRFVNNVAAGGEDDGIVYAFPYEPLENSRPLGLMQREEAFHTPLLEFSGNVAHSYDNDGLDLSMSITDEQDLYYTSKYEPKADPLNPEDSEDVQVNMTQITSYKNRWQNVNARGGFYYYQHCSFSDSARGFTFTETSAQSQYLTDSVILGESANIGEPEQHWVAEEKVYWTFPRSLPVYWDGNYPQRGISLMAGPHYFHNIWFNDFVSNVNYSVGAISFYDYNRWMGSPQTAFDQISWGFEDGASTGNRVWDDPVDPGKPEQTGESQALFRDIDGSVTGMVDSTVVKPYPMLYTDNCVLMDNWNMYACPHRYAKIKVHAHSSEVKNTIKPFMTRDDNPDHSFAQDWKTSAAFPVVIGEDYSYMLHFSTQIPDRITIYGIGIEKDMWVRIGVCIPKDAEIDLWTWSPDWRPRIDQWNQLDNMTSLESTDIATSYFLDTENGFVFFKLKNDWHRQNAFPYERDECPQDKCPLIRLSITNAADIDMDASDCLARAYQGDSAPYKRTRASVKSAPSVLSLPATSSEPPEGVGAGDSNPFPGSFIVEGDGYGEWTDWSSCSAVCGGGVKERSRSCQDESGCAGNSFHTLRCNTFPCAAEHQNVTEWSEWGDCSVTCGGGTQTRSRSCLPDKICTVPMEQTKDCNTEDCPVDGSWASWGTWSECSVTCGGGTRTRSRSCSAPTPQFGGLQCQGDEDQNGNCATQECADQCVTDPPGK